MRQLLTILFCFLFVQSYAQTPREKINLNENWFTIAADSLAAGPKSFESSTVDLRRWRKVDVPHNWDAYEGYRRLVHGNRHGYAWYRKTFTLPIVKKNRRYNLFFEGAGSYATVWVNGKLAGSHAGGRTTFTIDITEIIKTGSNLIAVRTDHPSGIRELPWVCGGCSEERGFSEGSQPMGIFRPVHLIVTNDLNITPFGVHAWSDIKNDRAVLHSNATIRNQGIQSRSINISQTIVDQNGRASGSASQSFLIKPADSVTIRQKDITVLSPRLWSTAQPTLYKIITRIREGNQLIDMVETEFGFRTIRWPDLKKDGDKRFYLNQNPVYINGIAEYEHQLGQSHAFSHDQIRTRMNIVKAAGFNAFRDAHQPHNLLYGDICAREGILWWTQMSAHIWYDSPAFRTNFKKLLTEWVIERRNNPAVVLWGLQNESKIPADFAMECTELIRQLDPTSPGQRLVTTCNGWEGTDWDVPQNWTGTYGGDPDTYDKDLKKQILIGEYGAWRSIDLHTEGPFVQNGPLSEDRMTLLMESKVRLAEKVRDSIAGQFFWLLNSHDNPGRVQGGEGLRELDRIGPVNYKGLMTPWEEPLDVFYMFRSNYANSRRDPMVYIVSHTWPDRWQQPGVKDSIIVYSNCDEVELFNGIDRRSLGRKKKPGIGKHYQWDDVTVGFNVLFARGYVDGKAVVKDLIILRGLPETPELADQTFTKSSVNRPNEGLQYIYRVNCGGPDYTDEFGSQWKADQVKTAGSDWGSRSWTDEFNGMPAFFASQRRVHDPIKGTNDPALFQDFRFGRDKLAYEFELPDGEYILELYFVEPWLGTGGMNCEGWRKFDIAVNGETVVRNLDIWKEAGHDVAFKKTLRVNAKQNRVIVSFPRIASGQALISAIAVGVVNPIHFKFAGNKLLQIKGKDLGVVSWADNGMKPFNDTSLLLLELPPNLFGSEFIKTKWHQEDPIILSTTKDADIYFGEGTILNGSLLPERTKNFYRTGDQKMLLQRIRLGANQEISLSIKPGSLVFGLPVTNMQPAYDLKPVKAYRTPAAKIISGFQKLPSNGRDALVATNNDSLAAEWEIETGVADIYSITLKYFLQSNPDVEAQLFLYDRNEALLMKEKITMRKTREGKWNQETINTGTMINAGQYRLVIRINSANGLAVSGVDIQ